jgi:hypothetical protein
MKKILFNLACLILVLQLIGCTASVGNLRENQAVKKVAVVSLSVSDWGGSVSSQSITAQDPVMKLIDKQTVEMLTHLENELSARWEVKRASSFIDNKSYRKEAAESVLTVLVPSLKGQKMPVFTTVSGALKKGDIEPDKAKALCKALQVDAVVVVFSEWTAKTGGVVPMTKAVSKNIVSFWDKDGQKIFTRRVDMLGNKPLGAMGLKVVNQETINEWTDTYKRSVTRIVREI